MTFGRCRRTKAITSGEQVNDDAVGDMVAEDLGFLNEQHVLCQFTCSGLFAEIDAEVAEEEVQANTDGASSVLAALPPRFVPRRHDHEASVSMFGAVDTADSGVEE